MATGISGQVSTKPWCLTFDNGEVLIWKSGCRLKLAKNQRAGSVISVSVIKESEKIILVSTNIGC